MKSLIAFQALLTAVVSFLAPGTAHSQGFTLFLTVLAFAVDARLDQAV